jgi:hypothetical protein
MFESLWQSLIDMLTLSFISPFWYWLGVGILIIVVATLAAWYFPVLRSLSGAVVMATVMGLVGYRRGETDAKAR